MRLQMLIAASLLSNPAHAADNPDGKTILARAADAAGGSDWINARTLALTGRAVFWGPTGAAPRSTADDYRMWRVFDPTRAAAHAAEGKVRIIAKSGECLLFTIGFDGTTTWTEKGVTPPAEAATFWASNFGFGIIRRAGDPGFKAERLADDGIAGHPLFIVRLTDPKGGETLFGIDAKSYAIRTMGFVTPKGWHVRTYDDFIRLRRPNWLQARKVTLYYNGVKANEVYWSKTVVNAPVDEALFTPPKP
jgi:hypothetical protein